MSEFSEMVNEAYSDYAKMDLHQLSKCLDNWKANFQVYYEEEQRPGSEVHVYMYALLDYFDNIVDSAKGDLF